ncbi:hypothetical protein [Paenibacillus taichungensis]
MSSTLSPAEEEQFRKAMEERKILYGQLLEVVKGKQAFVTTGAGWYADSVGQKFKINGVQNFGRVPHLEIESKEPMIGTLTKIKLIQWNHCKVLNEDDHRVSINEICRRIRREEKVISG